MKKLLSLAMSLGICVSGMTAVTSNAEILGTPGLGWFVVSNQGLPEYIQPCDEWNDYLDLAPGTTGSIYKFADKDYNSRLIRGKISADEKEADIFGEMWGNFTDYECSSMEEAELVKAYLDENYPKYSAAISEHSTDVIIRDDAFENLSYKEQFEVAKNIKANTGVKAHIVVLATPGATGYASGDTDMNGEVTITDAAQIMSFAANPDKYPLSEMAQIVGDVYNTGDGINNMDALQIQKMLAGVE